MTLQSKAPEFSGIHAWIHSSPLSMEHLKGKVVGIEFWTHGCGNCVSAAPHMQKLYENYGKRGFVLIGVHTPEFPEEKELADIKRFLMKNQLTYPVAVDFDEVMWRAYGNRYWPTLYLIDREGKVRHQHVGDGGYLRIAQDIEHLLSA